MSYVIKDVFSDTSTSGSAQTLPNISTLVPTSVNGQICYSAGNVYYSRYREWVQLNGSGMTLAWRPNYTGTVPLNSNTFVDLQDILTIFQQFDGPKIIELIGENFYGGPSSPDQTYTLPVDLYKFNNAVIRYQGNDRFVITAPDGVQFDLFGGLDGNITLTNGSSSLTDPYAIATLDEVDNRLAQRMVLRHGGIFYCQEGDGGSSVEMFHIFASVLVTGDVTVSLDIDEGEIQCETDSKVFLIKNIIGISDMVLIINIFGYCQIYCLTNDSIQGMGFRGMILIYNVYNFGFIQENDNSPSFHNGDYPFITLAGVNIFSSDRSVYSLDDAPTVNDDASHGYPVGALWVDTDANEFLMLIDNTSGAASWTTVGP